ncbi:MAG: hypothetical protein IPG51_11765 [Chloroflexi bacterium]|nr:hypothetical protein [Chloroflexota bacterium]
MGDPDAAWHVPALRGLTREQGIALLDRAAEVGLLTALGGGFYRIHPALPWYFRQLFEQYYGEQSEVSGDPDDLNRQSSIVNRQSPVRAFVEAMGQLGDYYHNQYGDGNRDVIGVLGLEEANLRHARRLARQHGWWGALTSAMQGLRCCTTTPAAVASGRGWWPKSCPTSSTRPPTAPCPAGRNSGAWSQSTACAWPRSSATGPKRSACSACVWIGTGSGRRRRWPARQRS